MTDSKIENPVRKVNPELVMEGTLKKIKRNFPKNNGTTLMCVKFLTEHPKYGDEFLIKVMNIVTGEFKYKWDNEEIILDPSTHQPVESDGN